MVYYDIDPAGVQGVINRTAGHAENLSTALKTIETHLSGASGQTDSAVIDAALGEFLKRATPSIKFCATRTTNTINATVKAVGDYHDGDVKMAANAQASATNAPLPTQLPGE